MASIDTILGALTNGPNRAAATVYALCAVASLLCTILLARGFHRTRTRLLLWSGLCFLFLSINNILLFVDAIVFPETEFVVGNITFAVMRSVSAVIGLLLLVFGLIWDTK